ncbi:MAG: hypothetical protein ACKVP4_06530 [Hyphomicrobium sp.]
MSPRQVGPAVVLQGIAMLIAIGPAAVALSIRDVDARATEVAIAVSALDLKHLALSDFGDVEPAR